MEQNINIQALLKEILEPIIDDCVTRALNKYINELRYDRPINDDVLGMLEAANYLKLSKATLYRLTMDRQIPHYKMGKRNYFRKEELDHWINKGRVKTQEDIENEANEYLSRKGRKF
jgi:excisionase family DNA binding protein